MSRDQAPIAFGPSLLLSGLPTEPASASAALVLPDAPYRTEVHLTMDGASYLGVGSWPDDLQPRSSNNLVLEWTPRLPETID